MTETPEMLRIIDANLNRIGEGLRVLEEFARMTLDDAALSQKLKTLRHALVRVDIAPARLLAARDAASDVGSRMNVPGEAPRQGAAEIAIANARRVQESLRVMEEMAKTPDLNLYDELYRQARFTLYDIEKELVARLLHRDKLARLRGLYVIIDTTTLGGRSHAAVAAQAIAGGAGIIQLRHKEGGKREMLAAANELKALCAGKGVLFIVNDSLDIALAADADGLHVGQEDLPVADARRLLPQDKVLGCSARTVEDAENAAADGADHLGVGAMYPTSTHVKTEVVGLERLREIREKVDLPLVAIGGIDNDNIRDVVAAGADAVAVINAVLGAADTAAAARQLVNSIQEVSGG